MSHDHSGTISRVLLLNIAITVAEYIGAFYSGSMALLADAGHNLSDVISLIIGYVGEKYSKTTPSEKPIKRHFLNAKGFHAALICLKKGVEIPHHPEDYGVFFTVICGEGLFTKSGETIELNTNQGVYVKKDEVRGIRALEDLVVLGIQDRPQAFREKIGEEQ